MKKQKIDEGECEVISREICEVVYLKKTTETTPIMDEFWDSKKDYLIIRDFFTYKNNLLSLIVCKNLKQKVRKINKPFIITELKKYSGQDIYSSFPEEIIPLINAIKKVVSKGENKAGDMLPFDNPIVFGAQTYLNQACSMDEPFGMFGWHGSQFGEVTRFYIVGIEMEQQYY